MPNNEPDQSGLRQDRLKARAFTLTLQLYAELKAGIGTDKTKETLGFSTGRIVRTCSVDYVADVENVARKAVANASTVDRVFVNGLLRGKTPEDTWVGRHAPAHDFQIIHKRVQQTLGAAFIAAGIHPYKLYSKPVDVR